jgi:hypothetical protein
LKSRLVTIDFILIVARIDTLASAPLPMSVGGPALRGRDIDEQLRENATSCLLRRRLLSGHSPNSAATDNGRRGEKKAAASAPVDAAASNVDEFGARRGQDGRQIEGQNTDTAEWKPASPVFEFGMADRHHHRHWNVCLAAPRHDDDGAAAVFPDVRRGHPHRPHPPAADAAHSRVALRRCAAHAYFRRLGVRHAGRRDAGRRRVAQLRRTPHGPAARAREGCVTSA